MEGVGSAYGAGKAGGPFDPISFVKKPQVILRAVSWLFAIIVFGCISSSGTIEGNCQYNNDPNACGYGIAIGVLAFLGLMALLVSDAIFDNISSIQQRKYIVIGDLVFSALWTFLWFVGFCYLTDTWRRSKVSVDGRGTSGVEAAIAFSFFSIASFAGLTVLAAMRYRSGAADAFDSTYPGDEIKQPTPSPYSSYPTGGEATGAEVPYQQQQQPFSNPEERQAPGMGTNEFNQPPTY